MIVLKKQNSKVSLTIRFFTSSKKLTFLETSKCESFHFSLKTNKNLSEKFPSLFQEDDFYSYKQHFLDDHDLNTKYHSITDSQYLKTSVVSSPTYSKEEVFPYRTLTTFEVYDMKKMYILNDFLSFLIFLNQNKGLFNAKKEIPDFLLFKSEETFKMISWFTGYLNLTDQILNQISPKDSFMTPRNYYRRVTYTKSINEKKIKEEKEKGLLLSPDKFFTSSSSVDYLKIKDFPDIGRLFSSSSSLTLYPRELRNYLFSSLYVDLDIENSHPSILLSFSRKYHDKPTPFLEEFVFERESLLKNLMFNTGKSREVCKESLLRFITLTPSNPSRDFHPNLLNEIVDIRISLYKVIQKGELDYSEQFVNIFNSKRKFNSYHESLVYLQSFYCQTLETYHILNFSFLLQKKYLKFLKNNSIEKLADLPFCNLIDKDVSSLNLSDTFLSLPFFDGFFIHTPTSFTDNIENVVNDLNKDYSEKNDLIKFVVKELPSKKKRLKKLLDLDKFEIMVDALNARHNESNAISLYFKFVGFFEKETPASLSEAMLEINKARYFLYFDLLTYTDDKSGTLLKTKDNFISRINQVSEQVLNK